MLKVATLPRLPQSVEETTYILFPNEDIAGWNAPTLFLSFEALQQTPVKRLPSTSTPHLLAMKNSFGKHRSLCLTMILSNSKIKGSNKLSIGRLRGIEVRHEERNAVQGGMGVNHCSTGVGKEVSN